MKPPKPKQRPVILFNPNWIPKFRGKLLQWLDEVVEASGLHPRQVADSPNILSHAGVSRKLLTEPKLREASRATLPTVRAWAKSHNRLVLAGKAVGLVEIKEVDWVGGGVQEITPKVEPGPCQESIAPVERPCPTDSPQKVSKKPSPHGPEKSRPAPPAVKKAKKSSKFKHFSLSTARRVGKTTSSKFPQKRR